MERTNKVEIKRANPIRVAVMAGGLGFMALLSGCVSAHGEGGGPPKVAEKPAAPQMLHEYFDNGVRKTHYENDPTHEYADIIAQCDGKDLVEQTEQTGTGFRDGGAAGNNIERSVNHPACADGKLTEADFTIAK